MQHVKKLGQALEVDDAQDVPGRNEEDITGDIGHHEWQRGDQCRQLSQSECEVERPIKRQQKRRFYKEVRTERG